MITVQKEIQIEASPMLVFNAISDPNKIVQYYPVDAVRSDSRCGGQIIFEGKVDGHAFTDYGVIDVFDPPREFSYSYWSDNHGTERLAQHHMTIRYLLSDTEQGTRLILEHKNLLTEERRNLMTGVWDFLLAQLKSYVEQT
ncbi:SRPBCC family protein [Methylomonas fluvii]|uniref:SRPBCC domain-containing protein n=1 Tax=Methylomonas fluvii TaxID=1854564 RepID=A0ABR9DHG3_9GAMM|nr:SRPBCC family protein [Methylomonas fluvii]MBD9362547.1 SRPBCC domain-containing protein [Methylomonas fluvii]